ncbi:hypothetical protein, partial [Sansalvadorimonas verongulae]|uniref:hypothetical protein n=1 Tax=Sansalvadorimonas verongulae TaxID=2172824 RepID=UPI0018AD1B14
QTTRKGNLAEEAKAWQAGEDIKKPQREMTAAEKAQDRLTNPEIHAKYLGQPCNHCGSPVESTLSLYCWSCLNSKKRNGTYSKPLPLNAIPHTFYILKAARKMYKKMGSQNPLVERLDKKLQNNYQFCRDMGHFPKSCKDTPAKRVELQWQWMAYLYMREERASRTNVKPTAEEMAGTIIGTHICLNEYPRIIQWKQQAFESYVGRVVIGRYGTCPGLKHRMWSAVERTTLLRPLLPAIEHEVRRYSADILELSAELQNKGNERRRKVWTPERRLAASGHFSKGRGKRLDVHKMEIVVINAFGKITKASQQDIRELLHTAGYQTRKALGLV